MKGLKDTALDVLAQLAAGSLDRSYFTHDADWWSNLGRSFPLIEFQDMLDGLHAVTIGGLKIDPGLIMATQDTVMIEATSSVPLKNGKLYSNRYVFLFHFDGQLVRQVREYNDTAHVLECFAIPDAA